MKKWDEKRKKQVKNLKKYVTLVAKSTFGFPFSNKSWTICSCPCWTAIKRGVTPPFREKKKMRKKKMKAEQKKKNKSINK